MPNEYFSVTYTFAAAGHGWTERWFILAGDLESALIQARGPLTPRKLLLGSGADVIWLTARTLDGSGKSIRARVESVPGRVLNIANARDTPWNAYLVSIRLNMLKIPWYVRGVRDDDIQFTAAGLPEPRPIFLDRINDFRVAAITAGFQMRNLSRNPLVNVPRPVNGLFRDAAGRVGITCAGHNYTEGQIVSISGVRSTFPRTRAPGRQAINGAWPVQAPIAGISFSIPLLTTMFDGVPAWISDGTVRTRTVEFTGLEGSTWSVLRFVRRKVGANRTVPRGRAPARRNLV